MHDEVMVVVVSVVIVVRVEGVVGGVGQEVDVDVSRST